MKQLALKNGGFALVDSQDYERASRYVWYSYEGYVLRVVTFPGGKRSTQRLHLFIMGFAPANHEIDHINRNKLDCQRANLRFVTKSNNGRNRAAYGKSGYKGVLSLKNGTFRANITLNKKNIYLGTFGTSIEAAKAFDKAAIATGNGHYLLNFPL